MAVDTVLPPRCFVTGEIVSQQGMVSPEFWQKLEFIHKPFCKTCGLPFEFDDMDDDSLCGACLQETPKFNTARAALVYNDAARDMLLRFKYGDKLHAAVTFANWLQQSAPDVILNSDLIVPVPLHWRRMLFRRYNQSALLAHALSKTSDRPVCHALKRRRFTGPQKGLNRKERIKNVRMSFAINPKNVDSVKDKNVILIDDVMTSGATINECAKVLKRYGANNVQALSVARVIKDKEYQPAEDVFDPFAEGY